MYTNNEEIIAIMKEAWWVLIIFILFDCLQGVVGGNISGLGIMKKVVWVTAFDYWVVGIPISYLAMFKADLKVQGLWFGPTLAVLLNYLFYSKVIYDTDWQEIADKTALKLE